MWHPACYMVKSYFFLHNLFQSICVQISTVIYFQCNKTSDNYLFPGRVTQYGLQEQRVTRSSSQSQGLEDTAINHFIFLFGQHSLISTLFTSGCVMYVWVPGSMLLSRGDPETRTHLWAKTIMRLPQ
jgi:hypothetical protein